ncbi:MAG: hypothetical protein O7C01_00920 [Actinobacteria bacterium]|nr:hypothetical protein [Actinomycetota bacterium]
MSRRITSMAKNMPAMGALKVAAIPAPAPAATSALISGSARRVARPTIDPMLAPI